MVNSAFRRSGVVVVAVWTAILTYIIIKAAGVLVGLRVSEQVEIDGLDITVRGEPATRWTDLEAPRGGRPCLSGSAARSRLSC